MGDQHCLCSVSLADLAIELGNAQAMFLAGILLCEAPNGDVTAGIASKPPVGTDEPEIVHPMALQVHAYSPVVDMHTVGWVVFGEKICDMPVMLRSNRRSRKYNHRWFL